MIGIAKRVPTNFRSIDHGKPASSDRKSFMRNHFVRLICVILSTILLPACNQATAPSRPATETATKPATPRELEHHEVLEKIWEYRDSSLQEYVELIGQNILDVTSLEYEDVRFTILDTEIVNAIAMPEGNIYITRGLLALLNSEAELAAILAHEIAHLENRHGEKFRDDIYRLPYIDDYLPGLDSPHLNKLGKISPEALLADYSQQQELEADRIATLFLHKAGYNPDAMSKVIASLSAHEWFESNVRYADIEIADEESRYSTHPDYQQRIENALDVYRELPDSGGKIGPYNFFQAIDGLLWGQNPERGAIFENQFVHTGFNITFNFPAAWQAENMPGYLAARSDDGLAEFLMMAYELHRPASPKEILMSLDVQGFTLATEQFNRQLPSAYGRAQFELNSQDWTPGYIFAITDNRIAYLFFAVDGGLDTHFMHIHEMLSGFRHLSDKESDAVQPLVLSFENLDGTRSWDNLAIESPEQLHPSLQLQILNRTDASREPKPKGYVKLIKTAAEKLTQK